MRRVCHFSCGASSAVAAKLTLARHQNVVVVNAFVAEEHPDNQRFLNDVEQWLGVEVVRLRDEQYGASAYEVFRRKRWIKSEKGAPCTSALKRRLLDAWSKPDDIAILGFTSDKKERARAKKYLSFHDHAEFPLIDAGLYKADCLAMIERAGIELPAMYRMGYANANCIGCVKGGMGYWNKIRIDFPERFEELAKIEDELGEGSYLFSDRKGGRISLRQLDPDAGRHDEPTIECGFSCLMAEDEFAEAELEDCMAVVRLEGGGE
jgi:3'-phosphoadenosine 5'-phosphosulfate sulfotransferase (PAPS reductase)/FAD synthetase